jgi:hypothetical protein
MTVPAAIVWPDFTVNDPSPSDKSVNEGEEEDANSLSLT